MKAQKSEAPPLPQTPPPAPPVAGAGATPSTSPVAAPFAPPLPKAPPPALPVAGAGAAPSASPVAAPFAPSLPKAPPPALPVARVGAGAAPSASPAGYLDFSPEANARRIASNTNNFFIEALEFFQEKYGESVARDRDNAVRLFKALAKKKDADGQCYLGICYGYGYGVAKNPLRAKELLTHAADQGHVKAQLNLARIYAYGNGVGIKNSDENTQEAVNWYNRVRKAEAKASAAIPGASFPR